MMKKRIRRTLVGYSDNVSTANKKKKTLQKKGFTNIIIKSDHSGFGIFGIRKKKKM